MRSDLLPDGARLVPLTMHADERGVFTELFRQSWCSELVPVQWNYVTSRAGVLRGVHVHVRHSDYLIVLTGRARIGLCDLRPGSPTHLRHSAIEMGGDHLAALVIPPGVAHGFYFYEPSHHAYAVSEYWSADDELGCRFDDPGLGLEWPNPAPLVSHRDRALPPLRALEGAIPPWQPREPPRPAMTAAQAAPASAT